MRSCSVVSLVAADQFIAEAEPWHQTSLFQPEDFYCGKHDHAFGEAGCSGVAPSERPLCFPLDTGECLDHSQEVHLLRGVLDVRVDEE